MSYQTFSTQTTQDHHANGFFCGGIDLERAGIGSGSAVKLTGRAGSASVHHVRLVHGSDLNTTSRHRRVLFYEVAAADAWPLCGTTTRFQDLASFDELMLAGKSTTTTHMRELPVRNPPPTRDLSSIYNAQKSVQARFFSIHSNASDEVRT